MGPEGAVVLLWVFSDDVKRSAARKFESGVEFCVDCFKMKRSNKDSGDGEYKCKRIHGKRDTSSASESQQMTAWRCTQRPQRPTKRPRGRRYTHCRLLLHSTGDPSTSPIPQNGCAFFSPGVGQCVEANEPKGTGVANPCHRLLGQTRNMGKGRRQLGMPAQEAIRRGLLRHLTLELVGE